MSLIKSPFRLALVVVAFFALGGCSRPSEVAIMTKLEAGSVVGSSEVNTAKLFDEDHRPPVLVVKAFDDAWDTLKSKTAFEAVDKAGIRFLITSHPSNCALAIAEAAEAAGVLTIITGSTTDALSGKDDMILRVVPDVRSEQEWQAARIVEKGHTSVLVVRDIDNEAYTKPAFEHFSKALPGVAIRETKLSIKSFDSESVRAAMAEKPYDLCYILVGSYNSAAGAVAQLSQSVAPAVPILFTPWMKTPAIVDTAGSALALASMPSHYPPLGKNPAVDAYVGRFKKRFGYSPTAVSLEVYSALFLLDDAFRAGARTPEAVKRHILARGTFDTSLGRVDLDANGDSFASFYMIEKIAAEF